MFRTNIDSILRGIVCKLTKLTAQQTARQAVLYKQSICIQREIDNLAADRLQAIRAIDKLTSIVEEREKRE